MRPHLTLTYPLGMPMDSRDLGAALPAGAMLGYGSHSPRFSGEAGKVAKGKAASGSAQGSLGFSGDSGRRGAVRPRLSMAQFIRSRGFHFRPRKKAKRVVGRREKPRKPRKKPQKPQKPSEPPVTRLLAKRSMMRGQRGSRPAPTLPEQIRGLDRRTAALRASIRAADDVLETRNPALRTLGVP